MDSQPDPPPGRVPKDVPLSDEQLQELTLATARAGKILGAAKVAAVTGWSVGVAGVVSLLLGLFSFTGFVTGTALLAVAWNELEGRKMLLRFHPGGPRRLVRNQLWLLALIAAYCGWAIYRAHVHQSAELSRLEDVLGLDPGFVAEATTGVYATILVVAVAFQWGMYRFHASRIPLMGEYVAKTPRWVLEVQRIVRGGQSIRDKR